MRKPTVADVRKVALCAWGTAALWGGATVAAAAAPALAPLAPATSKIEYTVFTLGMFPMSAYFNDFAGTVSTDSPPTGQCHVAVSVRIASLHMNDPVRTRIALGASMLDAAHFPTMAFTGQCAGATLTGALTLHGITHPLALTLRREGARVIATGMVQRRDYAITGMPGLVGQRIRTRLQTALPPTIDASR